MVRWGHYQCPRLEIRVSFEVHLSFNFPDKYLIEGHRMWLYCLLIMCISGEWVNSVYDVGVGLNTEPRKLEFMLEDLMTLCSVRKGS